ncbi:MAG: gas vesicle protein [Candidatus Rokubacteria bacterium]|nr:gas vesicle protein [Candidatus Rokubacteria bacterium]
MRTVTARSAASSPALSASEQVSLCEALDRVLNKGAVVIGELTISVADIDLIYLGLQVVLTSIETARSVGPMATLAGGRANGAVKEAGDGCS